VKKRIATLVAASALAGVLSPLATTGASAAPECVGSPAIPETYACIVRRDLFTINVVPGPVVHTVPFCALVLCVAEQAIPLIDVQIQDDEIVVLYYLGKCYYVGNGTVTSSSGASPTDC